MSESRTRIRFGDPCYRCGISMTPGGKMWRRHAGLTPAHMRQHDSHGLCVSCAEALRAGRFVPE